MKAKKIIFSLVILALFIGVFLRFNKDLNANLERQKTELNNKFKAEIVKSEYKVEQYNDTILSLEKKIKNDSIKIAKLQSRYIPKIEGVKHYNSTDIAKFYKSTYKLPNQVKTVENGTVLSDSVAKLNIRDVFQKDLATSELKSCKSIVNNQKSIIKLKDSTSAQKDTTIGLTKLALTDCKKANEVGKIETKKVKKKNVWTTILLVGIVVYEIIF